MTDASKFIVTRQDKPDNCQAVAIHNAMRWLDAPRIPEVEMVERFLLNASANPQDGLGHYEEAAWWVRVGYRLDVLMPVVSWRDWNDELCAEWFADGWVFIVGIDQPSGSRHAVALVGPGILTLDGLRSDKPLVMTVDELRRCHVSMPVGLRLPHYESVDGQGGA